MYHRFGHVEPEVKAGDRVKAGQRVASNGTGNGQWAAHCHYDVFREAQSNWNAFVIGWSKEKVMATYVNPTPWAKIVMPTFHHLGYGWLEEAQYSGGHAFHPGIDLNGPGSGNADLGEAICSPVDGVVVHVHKGTDGNSGWGDMVVIQEVTEESMEKEFVKAVSDLLGKKYGDNLNDGEQKDAAKRLGDIDEYVKSLENSVDEKNAVIAGLTGKADELVACVETNHDLLSKIEEIEKIHVATEIRVPAEDMTWSEHLGWAIQKLLPSKK